MRLVPAILVTALSLGICCCGGIYLKERGEDVPTLSASPPPLTTDAQKFEQQLERNGFPNAKVTTVTNPKEGTPAAYTTVVVVNGCKILLKGEPNHASYSATVNGHILVIASPTRADLASRVRRCA